MRECEQFLSWSLPKLGLNHSGFLRFQKPLCKRVRRRCRELGLSGAVAYRDYLMCHPEEWQAFDRLCHINISRFFRNRLVFERLRGEELPRLAWEARSEGRRTLRCCSLGVGSGEEPYSLRLLWDLYLQDQFSELQFQILGLDAEPVALERACCACYRASSLKELTERELEAGFKPQGEWFYLKPNFRHDVSFCFGDIRAGLPEGLFDVLLCRNLVFTYFDRPSQLKLLNQVKESLRPGGVFIIGGKEFLPVSSEELGLEHCELPGMFTLQSSARLIGA